jgi:hypothetical protein
MYGWKNLNPNSYPFIYNEIVGYSITAFTWIHTELGEIAALKAAYDASEWIIKNMEIYGNLLPAGRQPPRCYYCDSKTSARLTAMSVMS